MSGSRKLRREKVLQWMVANSDLWARLNAYNLRIHDRRLLVDRMKAGGVIAKTTYNLDINVCGYIVEARRRLGIPYA